MRSITDVVGQFKQNWTQQLSETGIAEACRESGMTWIASTLDPITIVQIFFLQILHGNTACEHMSHLARMTFTGAAYCKARMRVKLDVLTLLLRRSVEQLQEDVFDTGRWLGHRVFFAVSWRVVRVFRCPTRRSSRPTSSERRTKTGLRIPHGPLADHATRGHGDDYEDVGLAAADARHVADD